MGYRSQVRCLIYGEPNKIDAMVMKWRHTGGFDLWNSEAFGPSLREYAATHNGAPMRIIDMYGDDWKWYEDYPEVQAWEAFMRTAEEFDCQYEFMRIGEEDSDIEVERSGDNEYWLSISRQIVVDAPEPDEDADAPQVQDEAA